MIARHIGPDPDAIGSQIALRESIKLTFPDKKVYAIGAGVNKFKYLGYLDKLDYNSLTNALLIVLDVPNYSRVDGIEGLMYNDIIKIDHHPKEDIIGTVDFTSSDYSSTCEMVANLLYSTRLAINKEIATKLFLGIVSDSERFLFKNTSVGTLEMSLRLIKDFDLDFTNLYNNLYEKGFNDCKFEAYIIENLIITKNSFAYIIFDNKKVEEFDTDITKASTIINNFNFIKDFIVWCFVTFDEKNEIFKINIRSRGPVINEIAGKYNGGGHDFASGARITKKEDVDKLLKELDNECKKYLAKGEK
ncbi:MAG: bifunctional oligoribonuclease/PAP phosphatase NrnA [Mollicutes bacterium]|nr:bifunctional oligoribonuclease/PAP phosphatase NrnA [Mollicutes bacterium]